MTVNVNALINKVNFVRTARLLKDELQTITEYPPIPTNPHQEQEISRNLIFSFLKKQFPGCKVRVNTHSIMLRLDGHIHRKANKLREIFTNNYEWRNWFETNHNNLYRVYRNNNQSFRQTNYMEVREKDGKKYLYIPFKPNRINGYVNNGLNDMITWLRNEYIKDQRIADMYDNAITLMEEETERRERERREKYERELNEYMTSIRERLFRPITELEESANPADRVLGRYMREWCRENNKAPVYAVKPTYETMVPVETKVKIAAPAGSKEEGWYAVPMFEGYELAEGYELKPGWGKVTKHDTENDRARGGVAPIVIQDYIYTGFNFDYWKHLLPEGFTELYEATEQVRGTCAGEVEEFVRQEEERKAEEEARREAERLERERVEQERLAEERRLREEEEARLRELAEQERIRIEAEERAAREAQERENRERAERQERLREQLRQQVQRQAQARLAQTTHREETPDIDLDLPEREPVVIDTLAALEEFARQDEAVEENQDEVLEKRPGLYRRAVGQGHVYVLFTGHEERTYVRRGNAINAYRNAFDAEPAGIYDDTNYTQLVETIA